MVRPADVPFLTVAALRSASSVPEPLFPGRDFATQDYLGLAGGPEALVPDPDTALRSRLERFLHLSDVTTFASGTAAIRAALTCVLRPGDDVIVDAGAHSAMFETVLACGSTLHRSPPGSVDAVERRLRRLAANPRRGRLFVALSAVSAFGSTVADLPALADLAREFNAGLILDVSHDLGAMGQAGGGVMEVQGCLGRVDVLIGSFSKCFGSAGGFAGFRKPGIGQMTGPALAAQDAARVLAAFDAMDSVKGQARRRRLHGNVLRLRNHLMADGLPVMGQPSPLVPVRLPALTATARTALLHSAGVRVALIQAPLVGLHAPRWRIEVRSDHSPADVDDLADLIRDVSRVFDRRHLTRSATYA